MKLLQLLLRALIPLLERRAVAAERQAASQERTEDLLRTYLCHSDPEFAALLAGKLPLAEALAEPPDVYAEHGSARDLKAARLEVLRELYHEQHGLDMDDDALMAEYERLYEEAEQRVDAGVAGPGVN